MQHTILSKYYDHQYFSKALYLAKIFQLYFNRYQGTRYSRSYHYILLHLRNAEHYHLVLLVLT